MLDRNKLIASVEECLGWPYVSPGTNDSRGIDCSGLFVKAYRDQGASIYHGSNTIYRKYCSEKGKLSSVSQLKPGMAVFKWNPNTPEKFNDGLGDFQHIGLVTSVNPLRIVHASYAAGCVTTDEKLGKWAYWGWLKDVVDTEIRKHLARLGSISEEDLLKAACSQNADLYEVAYRQAEEEFQKVTRQVTALEEEAVKALTGESQLDLGVVNGMLLKHRARLEECQRTMEAKAKKEAEAENEKAAKAQVKEMLTWVERYDKATVEAKHMIIASLVDRIEIGENYEVHIQFKVSAEQFIRQTA